MEIIPQIGLILLLVFLNGFFVASEFALVSVRKTRVEELVKKGHPSAKFLQKAVNNLDTFISSTQLGITLASLALGWLGEPILASFMEPLFRNFLSSNAAIFSSHTVSFAIAFSIITFLHIVVGELAPKTIALQKAEFTSLFIIVPLTAFTNIFKPFIWFLNESGGLVLRLVGFKAPSGQQLVHSENEIKMILAQSAQEGAIEKGEAEMVYNVLKFGDLPVRSIMIPRTKIIAFEKNTTLRVAIKITQKNPHSRFPVYDNSIDNIVGFIHIKDIYRLLTSDSAVETVKSIFKSFLRRNEDRTLSQAKIIRKIPHLSELKRIDDVMIGMKKTRTHIAVVDDKDGGTEGIVTLEDVVESLVGEIHDEFESLEKN